MKLRPFAAAIAALALTTAATTGVFAQSTMSDHSSMSHKMAHSTMMANKTVYVCKTCKEYYTPAQAKMMHGKDAMGHMLTKMSMSKMPAGYKMGGSMMHGSMDHGKM